MRSFQEYVKGLPRDVREQVASTFRGRGGTFKRFNDAQRLTLSQAIFLVEDELEHAQCDRPPSRRVTVIKLRGCRNRVLDDLGENEVPKGRWGTGVYVKTPKPL